jgi:hypothetical protein
MDIDVKEKLYTCQDNAGLFQVIDETCNDPEQTVFFLPPDTIFSEDSLYNLYKEFAGEMVNVAIPHLRIIREKCNFKLPMMKNQLVEESFKILHYSAEYSKKEQIDNVWHKGIYLRKHTMNHCLPTMYSCNFIPEDKDLMRKVASNKYFWDSEYLAACYENRRLRILGSAALACCFELTGEMENRAALVRGRTEWHNRAEHRFTGCGLCTYTYY